MLELRPGRERGETRTGWLDSRHTFSFNHYYDPDHMGFGALRVINDDRVIPGAGFGTHGHRDMEILTWVIDGAIDHKDSMGTGSTIRPGELQRMTAGTGVTHSEFNHSETSPLRFLQIWIVPSETGLHPGYEQRSYPEAERRGSLRLIASGDGQDGSVRIHQDARVYTALLAPGEKIEREIQAGHVWVQATRGQLAVNGAALQEGDGAGLTGESRLTLEATADTEVLVFELA
jgi:quercetin 2,3-dioxygenase